MPATTTVERPPPAQIARAVAGVVPSELSSSPLLGILGVLIGAGLVTLTGRMLSLGLADLKRHVGISYDEGAWLDSAYNAALMFRTGSPASRSGIFHLHRWKARWKKRDRLPNRR